MKYNPQIVAAYFRHEGLPDPQFEIRYITGRLYRLDIGWPAARVGIEVQGGIHSFPRKRADGSVVLMPGAHGTTAGIRRDNEKSNLSLIAGWRVLKVEPLQLCMAETVKMVKALMGA